MFLAQKDVLCDTGAPYLAILVAFREFEKLMIFRCHGGAFKSVQKSTHGAFKGRQGGDGTRPMAPVFGPGPPRAGLARVLSVDKTTGIKKTAQKYQYF